LLHMKFGIYLHPFALKYTQNFRLWGKQKHWEVRLKSFIKWIRNILFCRYGSTFWFRFLGFVKDVTEKKKAEAKIIKANRLYSFSQMNQMIVRVTDQESLFREASTIAVLKI
jgi:hypothetical protein